MYRRRVRYGTAWYRTGARVGGDGMATALADADPTSTQGFRRRLLDGLITSIEERGYRDTTVADIVRGAKTSKRTF
jgi:AcrR family transcriptional regulator